MKTNFEKVSEYNKAIGNRPGGCIAGQLKIIESEFQELMRAKTLTERRGELVDLLVTTYGLAYMLGVDADKDFDKIHDANMSKFCVNAEEIHDSIEHYRSIGVDVRFSGELPLVSIISCNDQTGTDGKFYPRGKQLKPPQWRPAELGYE